MDDRELLDAIAGGDERSLEELISRYERRLAGFLRVLLANAADVEEVFWRTVTEVWRCAASYQGRSEPCFWILGIARNLAYRQLKPMQRGPSEALDPNQPDDSPGQDDGCYRKEIADAIPLLTAEHQEVLVLFYWVGHNSREISEILGIPPPTVRTRLHHARKNLKKLLGLERNQAEADKDLDSNSR